MKQVLEVEFSRAFGMEIFYPVNDLAKALIKLTGHKSFTRDKLEVLKEYFEIKFVQKEL